MLCALISSSESQHYNEIARAAHTLQPVLGSLANRHGEIINTINHNSANLYSGTFYCLVGDYLIYGLTPWLLDYLVTK